MPQTQQGQSANQLNTIAKSGLGKAAYSKLFPAAPSAGANAAGQAAVADVTSSSAFANGAGAATPTATTTTAGGTSAAVTGQSATSMASLASNPATWLALAAVGNEMNARNTGRRDDNELQRIADNFTGKNLTADVEYWTEKMFSEEDANHFGEATKWVTPKGIGEGFESALGTIKDWF
jgi:hypothetical protein